MPGVISAAAAAAAAAAAPRAAHRGSSQGGLRQYNERVVLQAVREHGALAGAEIARLTHLTPQTVSIISKRLLDDGLLQRGAPQRGKVGQPSVPLSLAADGAFAIGIKIGRRSMDTLLVDFGGQIRQRSSLAYKHADPVQLLGEIGARLKDLKKSLKPHERERVQGVGIAAPLSAGGWQQLLGLPKTVADRWHQVALRDEVARFSPWPVALMKDTAAACVAELVAGSGRQLGSFVYVFVDTFIGGALVLDGQLHAGQHGNAGALGSMAVARAVLARGPSSQPPPAPPQLLGVASLLNLEQIYAAAGLPVAAANDARAMQGAWLPQTQRWLAEAGPAIAHALHASACLLDIGAVVLDGSFDPAVRDALISAVADALPRYSWEGVSPPRLQAGSIGADARALGGALLPLYQAFSPDRELFLKVAV